MDVLEEGGAAAVEGYPLQGLTWEQVKELKGPNLVGLGMGSRPAPGSLSSPLCTSTSQVTSAFRVQLATSSVTTFLLQTLRLYTIGASWESKDF